MICPLCSQLFKNPKYLPCCHSYCEECLEEMQEYSKITCLKCRNETIVPAGGVKDLPSNYFMDNLVNKLILNYKLETETELRCEECDKDNSMVVFCTDCKLFLCHFCKESHKYSKSHCSHNLISLTELRSNKDLIQSKSKFPTCQEHDLELEYYCETCEKLVCVQCTGEHEDHKYDVVKKFADKYKSEFNKIDASVEIMTENLSKLSDSIEDMRTTIRQQGDEISEEVDLYYDKLIEKLLKQKEQVKQQVRYTILQKEKALTEQRKELIYIQEDILNVKEMRDSLQESSDQEGLSASNQLAYSLVGLTEKCVRLGTGPIESANIRVTPAHDPLPQVVKHFVTIDSLSFEVIAFKNSVQRGQTAMLELIAKDCKGNYYSRGGCEVTAQLAPMTGEMISAEVMDNNDGTYMICCVAQQVGEIELSVFVNGHEIKDSPFRIAVQENPIKPSKIITSHDDSFGQLWGIACSNNGMWAVADWINNCVHVFDSQDKPIKKIGSRGNGNGQFEYPCDVAFDNNNELYVTDSHNHRVQKFDTRGNYLLQFGSKGESKGKLKYPIGITIHSDKVYIADRHNNRISVFRKNGKFSGTIGQQHLSQHFDISVDMDTYTLYSELVVVDWRHHCIYTFTLDGQCTNTFTTRAAQLKAPCSVTTYSDGLILITDTYNHTVLIFDETGKFMYYFGSKGSDDGEFNHPHGIAIAPNGSIYISDTCNKRVQIFSNSVIAT